MKKLPAYIIMITYICGAVSASEPDAAHGIVLSMTVGQHIFLGLKQKQRDHVSS